MRFDNAGSRVGAVLSMLAALTCVLCVLAPAAYAQFRLFGGRDGRRVTLRASDGAALSGMYYEPSRRPAAAVILLHMLKRTHTDWDSVASQLSDAGFAVLALDFRGGDDVAAFASDVLGAKAFLRERPEIAATRIGIAGASVGANVGLLDAADDAGVMSVALLSPGLDYRGLRIEAAMKKYGGRPALLIGGTKDPYSARSIKELITIGPGTREVRLVDAAAHGTMLLSKNPDLVSALVDWFKRTL